MSDYHEMELSRLRSVVGRKSDPIPQAEHPDFGSQRGLLVKFWGVERHTCQDLQHGLDRIQSAEVLSRAGRRGSVAMRPGPFLPAGEANREAEGVLGMERNATVFVRWDFPGPGWARSPAAIESSGKTYPKPWRPLTSDTPSPSCFRRPAAIFLDFFVGLGSESKLELRMASGHLNPSLPMARLLLQQGHQVHYLCRAPASGRRSVGASEGLSAQEPMREAIEGCGASYSSAVEARHATSKLSVSVRGLRRRRRSSTRAAKRWVACPMSC